MEYSFQAARMGVFNGFRVVEMREAAAGWLHMPPAKHMALIQGVVLLPEGVERPVPPEIRYDPNDAGSPLMQMPGTVRNLQAAYVMKRWQTYQFEDLPTGAALGWPTLEEAEEDRANWAFDTGHLVRL